ncbi:putative ferric-chelate reductase 1 homolog [Tetranychus urticae]|uniref:ascorbate ferrireductase (transmembrane) n=1 Tax=Tetranychus urticae TaxID=32264 RepID=T1KC78_TETUR|nr:putative ferric-chelate reductase 1 homolog [Tetranychus urticae]
MFQLFIICALFYQFPLTNQASLTDGCIDGSKLCFGIPGECASSATFTCDMLVLISAKPDLKDGLDVDLYASNVVDRWYGLGFVEKKGMFDATVVYCDTHNGISVGEGVTVKWALSPLPANTLISSSSGKLEDGLVHCKWVQKASGTAGSTGIEYDINKPYHVQLGYGPMENDGKKVAKHLVKTITPNPVYLNSTGIIVPSSKIPLKVRIHGSFMTVAWLCLVSIAMMIARYHKNSWGETTIGNVKVWFALHRGLMICALISAAAGMISILVHVKGWRADTPHQYLGLFANILMILQPIGALFRPSPDHENRVYFNIIHFLGGSIGHTLAILALFFVLSISSVNLSMAFLWLLASFVLLLVATHIILQFHPHLLATLNIIEDIQMGDPRNKFAAPSPSVVETVERSKKRVLTIYILLVLIITISVLVIVNKGKPN